MSSDSEQMSDRPQNGVVLHQGALGDFVLSLSVVQAFRAALPVRRVVAVAGAASARLAAGRSVIDACIQPDAVGLHTLFSESSDLDERLMTLLRSAAWVLSVLGDEASPPACKLRAAVKSVIVCFDPRPRVETLERRQHIATQWIQDIRRAGVGVGAPHAPQIELPPPSIMSTGQRIRNIMIHPGSGAREKCWPFDRYIALAHRLADARVLWVLGPVEIERSPEWLERLNGRIAAGTREEILVDDDLIAVARHIAAADLFLGNDAGLTHVAAAMRVPTVAIYGPTDPQVWRPLNANISVVSPAAPGPIEGVSIADVLEAIVRR